ncbi:MAG: SUF system NifU family Fe-S cluster assembly protein [Thiohalocapsa sp.]|nr:SUF system NifU family Fe-S cluster assembly protein [Thiohalocapsa sp.]MCF7989844.1 SUF system NifU family Fe-S cluster assembly protein [Thiohalocapsa sp.]
MSDEMEDLYQEVILDHNRRPANFRPMPDANRTIEADNPLCGDRLELFLRVEGDRIEDVSFLGSGCAISVASASMLTEHLKGATVADAEALFAAVHAVLTDEKATVDEERLGNLMALSGVRRYPMRVKCATLSWHALKAALASRRPDPVTTE